MVRSRRRSTRLTGHSPQDELTESPTKNKKRDSGHGISGYSSSSASRESSCHGAGRKSKSASFSPAPRPRTQDDKTAKATTKEAAKDRDNGTALPLFPHLPVSKVNSAASHGAGTEPITAPRNTSVDTPSEGARKDHVSNKWVKTARGSIRLASDAPAEASKDNTYRKSGEGHEGQNAPSAAARRSRRLASLSPDVADETIEVEQLRSRKSIAVKAKAPQRMTAGSDEPQEWELDLEDFSAKSGQETGLPNHSTHHEEPSAYDDLPARDGKTGDPLNKEPQRLKNITPIPELVADIERIIASSPLAAKDAVNDGTKGTSSPTPAPAVKKQAPAGVLTRSRALRSSSLSIDGAARIQKSSVLESVDSESSQFDGAHDDGTQGQKRKKAQAKCGGRTNATRPSEPRGTKRSVQELSESEASAPSSDTRQRQNPASDHSSPDVDLSTSNPIASATSRDAFAVDDPRVEVAVGISEFARRSGEPPNPVTLAHIISSSRPELPETDNDSTRARDGSHYSSSPERMLSDADSMRGHHGSRESSRPQSPEADRPTCADCGRAPERYIVCAKCLAAVYCGKYCQLWNWPLHKMRCGAADGAVQEEVDAQERYLGDMWVAALRMLEEEEEKNSAGGGTLESLLLDEAVGHSAARPSFMGQGRPHGGLRGVAAGASRPVPRDSELLDGSRAMAIQLAKAAQGGDE